MNLAEKYGIGTRLGKFRVWDSVNKEWFDETTTVLNQHGQVMFWNLYRRTFETLDEKYIPVFFSGLVDKFGVKIFDGDIVASATAASLGASGIGYCCFSNGEFHFRKKDDDSFAVPEDTTWYEVVGNVFEDKLEDFCEN